MKATQRYLVGILVLAALYIVAAKIGLSLALTVKQITTVWPPSGLALAVLVLYGRKFWPGVFLGAFVANLLTSEPSQVALGIAVGNTLEAVAGASLLRWSVRLRPSLERVKDVIGLAVLSAAISTMISASIGTLSLAFGGLLLWSGLPTAWLLWWFGDMAGVLLFAPVLLVWQSSWRQLSGQNKPEATTLVIGTGLASLAVFFGQFSLLGAHASVPYLVFPFVIWAAFRFKQLGVTVVSLIASFTAVLGTIAGQGPFVGTGTVEQQLVILLLYIILITMSGLFMAVAVSQREVYAERMVRQSQDLRSARDSILSELSVKAKREEHLQATNERITDILESLLDEGARRINRRP